MFRPNQSCIIYSEITNDVYGTPILGGAVSERCAVTTTATLSVKSTVRADSSATRGNAREIHIDSIVLLTKGTVAKMGDVIEFDDVKMRITKMICRKSVFGRIDHYEVSGTYWSAT